MAYDTIKAEIRQYIKTNGANEITGQILQNVLLDMVNAYPSLDGYATQQWVQNQLSDMATMTWVGQQGFVTASALSGYLPLTGGTLTGDLNMAYSHKLNFGTSYIYEYTIPGPHGTNMGHILNFHGVDGNGYYDFDNSVHATSFVKADGTSSQFLKADGSVDSNTYLTSAAISDMATQTWVGQQGFVTASALSGYATQEWVNTQLSGYATQSWVNTQFGGYLPLTGGTLTGDLNMAYSHKLNFGTSYIYEYTIPGPHGTNMGHILNFHGVDGNGYYDFDNSMHATSFVKTDGTSSQFLKADGSVDSNTYLTSSAISDMATQTWVGQQGFLTSSAISDMATQTWVGQQGYITSAAISDMATQTWVGQQGFLTSVPSGYATETWVGNNYLPLTGGTITGNLIVNGTCYLGGTSAQNAVVNIADSAQIVQTNQSYQPYLLFHKPNVNWTRLVMTDDGTIQVKEGETGTSYRGFSCGNLNVNGTLKFGGADLEIFESSWGMLVMKNDAHDIVLGSIGNNYYVNFIEDIQGGTANSDYTMNTFNWGITTAGAATFVSVTQTSDIRRKNIISDIDMAIDDIAKAPMFRFTMKDDNEAIVRVGTSAQYWQTVIPEVVSEDKRGVLGMQYDVAALAGVTTVAKVVVDHEDRISAIERKLNIN